MSVKPIIFKSAKTGFHGNDHGFFVVSSENLEFVGWHSGALPWSISFLVEDWSLWAWFFLQIDDEARFLASSTYPLLPPTSLLFCWVLTETKKKYNLLKRIYCRNGIEGRSVLDREIVKNPGQKVAEIHDIIELNETLGRFWKTKRDDFEGVLRFRKEA